MTQEDKELLLQDLCARLPYGVKLQLYNGELDNDVLNSIDTEEYIIVNGKDDIENIKPYLFHLSSMTEEQKSTCMGHYHNMWVCDGLEFLNRVSIFTHWLNKNHFDYRGLIEKGLAIDCSNLNIY